MSLMKFKWLTGNTDIQVRLGTSEDYLVIVDQTDSSMIFIQSTDWEEFKRIGDELLRRKT